MKIDIILLAPIREEYRAVRQHLVEVKTYSKKGINCEVGTFEAKNKTLRIAIIQKGKGLVDIALATERALNHFQTNYVFLVGTAGGIKKVTIGDVVIGTKGYNYEAGRALEDVFRPTPKVRECDQELVELALIISQKKDWLQRIKHGANPTDIKLIAGPIASGEKVVETNKSMIIATIQRHYQDTIALEMEAYGFLEAAFKHKKVKALIIRSISDLLVDKTIANQQGSRELAASHAAAFAFEVIHNLPFKRKRNGLWLLGVLSILLLGVGKMIYQQYTSQSDPVVNIEKSKKSPLDTLAKMDTISHHSSPPKQSSESIPKRQRKTFTLDKRLTIHQIEQLEKSLKSKHVFKEAVFTLEFSHTGQFINNPGSELLYYYSGGYLSININGHPCCCNQEKAFRIPATSFPGNRRVAEEKRIVDIQTDLINKNFDSIVQTLKTCLQ